LVLPLELLANYCYSIETEVDTTTPVSPLYQFQYYEQQKCHLSDIPYLFDGKKAYVGCYKEKKTAKWVLKHSNFPFKNPKIVHHKISIHNPYVVFPTNSTRSLKKTKEKLNTIYKKYTIQKISKKFPTHFYGHGIKIVDFQKVTFLPLLNLYSLHEQYKKIGAKDKILILYDGVYNLEMLYKKVANINYIKKLSKRRYEIKIPIFISPTASLVIKNKIVDLQTCPKSMFIAYYGKLYLQNSKFSTWDTNKNRYAPREKIAESKLFYLNYEQPRPYFIGLAGSRSFMINNTFQGIGFHSGVSTFGVSLLFFPNERYYYKGTKAFDFFLSKNNPPKGLFVGNEIYDSTMGFYTNGAIDSYYLGNYLHDNIIYNFDPHDYSKRLVIARNLATKAKHAHGIIISREVDYSIIAQNISLKNHSAGIMLDRLSNHNTIYDNLSLANGYMGISIQESKNVLITNNTLAMNSIDGVMVRNSLAVTIKHNNIFNNGKNGVEVLSKSLNNIPGRNFLRDPYYKAAAAVVEKNRFKNNYNSNIMVKNSAALYMRNNINKGPQQYKGDLNFFYKRILKQKNRFRLYGRGFPMRAVSSDLKKLNPVAFSIAKNIYIEMADKPNTFIGTDLGINYLKMKNEKLATLEFQRASTNLTAEALNYLGYLYLEKAREENYKNKNHTLEGVTFVIENAILQNPHSIDLDKLIYFLPHSKELIEKAFHIAINRMLKGELFPDSAYKNSPYCKNTLRKRDRVQTAANIFLYKMNLAKKSNFLEYCQLLQKDFTLFKRKDLIVLKKRLKAHNRTADFIRNYNIKRISTNAKDDLCRKYLERHSYFTEQSQSLIREQRADEIKEVLPLIKQHLKQINEFRTKKIPLNDIIKILNAKEKK
jgi:poly(beta-D-mannuronate) C5 epimerase